EVAILHATVKTLAEHPEGALVVHDEIGAADGERRGGGGDTRLVLSPRGFDGVARSAILHAQGGLDLAVIDDGLEDFDDAEAVEGDDVVAVFEGELDGGARAGAELGVFADG